MPHEELDHVSDQTRLRAHVSDQTRLRALVSDQTRLRAMYASANDTRYIVRRTLELIEQSRIMLRELDINGTDGRRNSKT